MLLPQLAWEADGPVCRRGKDEAKCVVHLSGPSLPSTPPARYTTTTAATPPAMMEMSSSEVKVPAASIRTNIKNTLSYSSGGARNNLKA